MNYQMQLALAMKRTGELETAIVMVKALMKGNDNPDLINLLAEAEAELLEVKKELAIAQHLVERTGFAH